MWGASGSQVFRTFGASGVNSSVVALLAHQAWNSSLFTVLDASSAEFVELALLMLLMLLIVLVMPSSTASATSANLNIGTDVSMSIDVSRAHVSELAHM
jgi:hypothetical protein